MYFTILAAAAFDATHHVDEHEGCGHRWSVRVHSRAFFNSQRGRLNLERDLQRELDALILPLWNRSLNDMLTAASPTPEGIATWLSEQLVATFPDITRIDVAASYGPTVSLHREIRRVGGVM